MLLKGTTLVAEKLSLRNTSSVVATAGKREVLTEHMVDLILIPALGPSWFSMVQSSHGSWNVCR